MAAVAAPKSGGAAYRKPVVKATVGSSWYERDIFDAVDAAPNVATENQIITGALPGVGADNARGIFNALRQRSAMPTKFVDLMKELWMNGTIKRGLDAVTMTRLMDEVLMVELDRRIQLSNDAFAGRRPQLDPNPDRMAVEATPAQLIANPAASHNYPALSVHDSLPTPDGLRSYVHHVILGVPFEPTVTENRFWRVLPPTVLMAMASELQLSYVKLADVVRRDSTVPSDVSPLTPFATSVLARPERAPTLAAAGAAPALDPRSYYTLQGIDHKVKNSEREKLLNEHRKLHAALHELRETTVRAGGVAQTALDRSFLEILSTITDDASDYETAEDGLARLVNDSENENGFLKRATLSKAVAGAALNDAWNTMAARQLSTVLEEWIVDALDNFMQNTAASRALEIAASSGYIGRVVVARYAILAVQKKNGRAWPSILAQTMLNVMTDDTAFVMANPTRGPTNAELAAALAEYERRARVVSAGLPLANRFATVIPTVAADAAVYAAMRQLYGVSGGAQGLVIRHMRRVYYDYVLHPMIQDHLSAVLTPPIIEKFPATVDMMQFLVDEYLQAIQLSAVFAAPDTKLYNSWRQRHLYLATVLFQYPIPGNGGDARYKQWLVRKLMVAWTRTLQGTVTAPDLVATNAAFAIANWPGTNAQRAGKLLQYLQAVVPGILDAVANADVDARYWETVNYDAAALQDEVRQRVLAAVQRRRNDFPKAGGEPVNDVTARMAAFAASFAQVLVRLVFRNRVPGQTRFGAPRGPGRRLHLSAAKRLMLAYNDPAFEKSPAVAFHLRALIVRQLPTSDRQRSLLLGRIKTAHGLVQTKYTDVLTSQLKRQRATLRADRRISDVQTAPSPLVVDLRELFGRMATQLVIDKVEWATIFSSYARNTSAQATALVAYNFANTAPLGDGRSAQGAVTLAAPGMAAWRIGEKKGLFELLVRTMPLSTPEFGLDVQTRAWLTENSKAQVIQRLTNVAPAMMGGLTPAQVYDIYFVDAQPGTGGDTNARLIEGLVGTAAKMDVRAYGTRTFVKNGRAATGVLGVSVQYFGQLLMADPSVEAPSVKYLAGEYNDVSTATKNTNRRFGFLTYTLNNAAKADRPAGVVGVGDDALTPQFENLYNRMVSIDVNAMNEWTLSKYTVRVRQLLAQLKKVERRLLSMTRYYVDRGGSVARDRGDPNPITLHASVMLSPGLPAKSVVTVSFEWRHLPALLPSDSPATDTRNSTVVATSTNSVIIGEGVAESVSRIVESALVLSPPFDGIESGWYTCSVSVKRLDLPTGLSVDDILQEQMPSASVVGIYVPSRRVPGTKFNPAHRKQKVLWQRDFFSFLYELKALELSRHEFVSGFNTIQELVVAPYSRAFFESLATQLGALFDDVTNNYIRGVPAWGAAQKDAETDALGARLRTAITRSNPADQVVGTWIARRVAYVYAGTVDDAGNDLYPTAGARGRYMITHLFGNERAVPLANPAGHLTYIRQQLFTLPFCDVLFASCVMWPYTKRNATDPLSVTSRDLERYLNGTCTSLYRWIALTLFSLNVAVKANVAVQEFAPAAPGAVVRVRLPQEPKVYSRYMPIIDAHVFERVLPTLETSLELLRAVYGEFAQFAATDTRYTSETTKVMHVLMCGSLVEIDQMTRDFGRRRATRTNAQGMVPPFARLHGLRSALLVHPKQLVYEDTLARIQTTMMLTNATEANPYSRLPVEDSVTLAANGLGRPGTQLLRMPYKHNQQQLVTLEGPDSDRNLGPALLQMVELPMSGRLEILDYAVPVLGNLAHNNNVEVDRNYRMWVTTLNQLFTRVRQLIADHNRAVAAYDAAVRDISNAAPTRTFVNPQVAKHVAGTMLGMLRVAVKAGIPLDDSILDLTLEDLDRHVAYYWGVFTTAPSKDLPLALQQFLAKNEQGRSALVDAVQKMRAMALVAYGKTGGAYFTGLPNQSVDQFVSLWTTRSRVLVGVIPRVTRTRIIDNADGRQLYATMKRVLALYKELTDTVDRFNATLLDTSSLL